MKAKLTITLLIVLMVLVQVFQSFGNWLARKSDKRLKH